MATVINASLSAVVVNVPPTSPRFNTATVIRIEANGVKNADGENLVVGTKTLGGRYSQTQALAEFHRNPKSFAAGEGWAVYANGFAR